MERQEPYSVQYYTAWMIENQILHDLSAEEFRHAEEKSRSKTFRFTPAFAV